MTTAAVAFETRQAPGWWPSLVVTSCSDCGWTSGVIDLTARPRGVQQEQWRHERDEHGAS